MSIVTRNTFFSRSYCKNHIIIDPTLKNHHKNIPFFFSENKIIKKGCYRTQYHFKDCIVNEIADKKTCKFSIHRLTTTKRVWKKNVVPVEFRIAYVWIAWKMKSKGDNEAKQSGKPFFCCCCLKPVLSECELSNNLFFVQRHLGLLSATIVLHVDTFIYPNYTHEYENKWYSMCTRCLMNYFGWISKPLSFI